MLRNTIKTHMSTIQSMASDKDGGNSAGGLQGEPKSVQQDKHTRAVILNTLDDFSDVPTHAN